VHEHQREMGSSAEYLDETEIKWRELPTVRSSSGGSGERRLGVGAISAKGWPELDRISSGG
jgi:hypothetical protein